MTAWAACVSSAECAALAPLRLLPGAECAEIGDKFWLRGQGGGEELERVLAKVPGLAWFELLESGRLKSPHSRIPGGNLPDANWRPLKEALALTLPAAALGGDARQKLAVTLVRSTREQPAAALLTSLEEWTRFATQAPAIRLEPLAFAVADDQQTLVVGRPLPALRGPRFANHSGILVPCGYAWSPAVDAAVLRDLYTLMPLDVVVLSVDGTSQIIRAEQFVRATRAAARVTAAGFEP